MTNKQIGWALGLLAVAVTGVIIYKKRSKKEEEKSNFSDRKKNPCSCSDTPPSGSNDKRQWVKCGDNAQGHWFQYAPCPASAK